MARKHSDLPKLFQRTAHGNYYFRRMTGNKRITINTGTGDLNAAKKFVRHYLSGESAMALAAPASKNVHQIATALAQSVVGQSIERTQLTATFDIWIRRSKNAFGLSLPSVVSAGEHSWKTFGTLPGKQFDYRGNLCGLR